MSTFIIAEAGVNHNGSLELAKQLVDAAQQAGADCIKFQTFIAENIVVSGAEKADYQKKQDKDSEKQLEMLQKLALPFDDFLVLSEYCQMRNIAFLSTPFDFVSLSFLAGLDMPFWKVPSGEITNLPYLIEIARTHKPVVLSTGMSTLDEVQAAVQVLKKYGSEVITLLHCTTEYPAPYCDVNLKAMLTMKEHFNLPVGYSDHTNGIEIPVAAVAMGALIIEKHFTLDKDMVGPDHKASLEPKEFANMVKAIRNVEFAMGNGLKKPAPSEMKNIVIARKSIVAGRKIKKDEFFSEDNITTKRPGTGISPMRWFEVLGKQATRDFEEDELIVL